MDTFSVLRKIWFTILILFVYFDNAGGKRGGVSMGRARGGSHSRSGGGIFGSSGSRSSAGTAGGTWGRTGGVGVGTGSRQMPKQTNTGGGIFGGSSHGSGYKTNQGSSGFGRSSGSRYSKSGIGSVVRSNQFKNAIVGAAAGYLTYQAGKHLIRSAMAPMMWNNRPYYWGSNYYQNRPGQTMCRMPLDQTDSQLGNVYFNDNTRPREIVWGCGYNEYCCGYECCRGNSGNGFGGYDHYGSYGLGSVLIVLLMVCCSCLMIRRYCMNSGYVPGVAR